jgi:hypothetical protein
VKEGLQGRAAWGAADFGFEDAQDHRHATAKSRDIYRGREHDLHSFLPQRIKLDIAISTRSLNVLRAGTALLHVFLEPR